MSEQVTTMFALDTNGDISFSDNGVLRTVSGTLNTTNVSAIMMLNTVKGSYIFAPTLGLNISEINNQELIQGMTARQNTEDLIELMISTELERDPFILQVKDFIFTYPDAYASNRELEVTFTVVSGGGAFTGGIVV
jgi:hypothetical protein